MKPDPNRPLGSAYRSSPVLYEKVAYLVVSLPLAAVLRHTFFEWLTPFVLSVLFGAPLLGALVLLPLEIRRFGSLAFPVVFGLFLAVIVALSVPVTLLVRLCSPRLFLVEISSAGLTRSYESREVVFPWSKFFWVIERNGDLWVASFMDGCFIPREAFAFPADAREFAAIVRKLKQSGGASWRAQWNGRVFGTHPFGQITRVSD